MTRLTSSSWGRRAFRAVLFAIAAAALAPALVTKDAVGQGHVMSSDEAVTFQAPIERQLFFSLICMCGCPRETLGTCGCDYAHQRRAELRQMLADGMTLDEIHTMYEKRFGTQALAVPPNRGATPLMWAIPLVALIGGAFLAVRLLRRWAKRGELKRDAADDGAEPLGERDAYDDRLDDELKDLDRG
jgi:cytochrome c-type biogenesis protein CcmH/NrfF